MWTLTPIGFYSAVRKPGDSFLTLRARVAEDLDALRAQYLPSLSATVAGGGTDYPYRATCTAEAWGLALADMGRGIDYANFKDEVARRQGYGRAHAYGAVWSALRTLEDAPRRPSSAGGRRAAPAVSLASSAASPASAGMRGASSAASPASAGMRGAAPAASPASSAASPASSAASLAALAAAHPGKRVAAGGVVMDDAGRVLMRLVAGRFDGEGWTWAKGRPSPGESLEQAALREVLEETGVRAAIVSELPGAYPGSSTVTRYWRMRPLEDTGRFDHETEAVAWLTPDEARHRIRATTTGAHKVARDLAVLEAALADAAGEGR